MTSRLVAGCMTGTSIDSIDAALVRIEGNGPEMTPRFIRGASRPLGELAPRLRALAEQHPVSAGDIAALSREFSLAHVPVLRELLGMDCVDLIAVHGQTVFHQPPTSWQMLSPAPIALALRTPVVFDLRAADLAAGGQGAPITPLADWAFFRRMPRPLSLVNLGGFCNVTLLAANADQDHPGLITGRDVCPCNHLLDTIARDLFHVPYDDGGRRAAEGSVHDEALVDLDGILASLEGKRRSLGTGDEVGDWISRWRSHVAPPDLAASACESIGHAIAAATAGTRSLLLAGGGVKNKRLVEAIRANSAAEVAPAPDGLAEYREAASMAVLGALCQDRFPITLTQVTGVAIPPVAGIWVFP